MNLVLWEIWTYVEIPLVWYLFKRFAKRNVAGDIIAGAIFGVVIEFISEPLWVYHFKINCYKDIPLSIPFSWGIVFSLVTFLSEKTYCKFLERPDIRPFDKRIFVFDLFAGLLVGLPAEIIGIKTGIWEYRYDLLKWDWGEIPFIHMPYEALAGYTLLMLVAPTFVRYWQASYESQK